MSYYKEIGRATRDSDHIINEILYVMNQEIDLIELEKTQEGKYECNFMKVFHKRLSLHMEGDKTITIDKNIVKVLK